MDEFKDEFFDEFNSGWIQALNFSKIDNLDNDNFSKLNCVIHDGIWRTTLIKQSDKKILFHNIVGTELTGVFLTKIELKKEEYEKLLEHHPDLLFNVETSKKTSITLDK